jgi:hypothetical protein
MLVDHTSFSRKEAQAVQKLLSVYVDNFVGESFYIAKNPVSGNVYMSLVDSVICPFVTSDGFIFYQVFNHETGETFESDSLEEVKDYFANIYVD